MFGSDFIVIKDDRGFKTGFHWSDVHTVLENYEKDRKCVKVKFYCDPDGSYSLKFIMTLDEFLGQVEGQLNPQDTRKHTPNPYDFPPPPLVGFNCRKYDNHIIWHRMMGADNKRLHILSSMLVSNDFALEQQARALGAYNLSYTDVYDFASAANKKGNRR